MWLTKKTKLNSKKRKKNELNYQKKQTAAKSK